VTTLRLEDVTNLWDAGGGIFLDGLAVAPADAPPPPPAGGPGPVYNPANGHWYQAVRINGTVTWPQARAAAEAMTHQGYRGHLATVTSEEENRFILAQVNSVPGGPYDWWLGAYQDRNAPDYREPGGGWRWVTGEAWGYTAWKEGEPNDLPHNENAVHMSRFGLTWNDLPESFPLSSYVVEFGPPLPPPPPPPAGGPPAAPSELAAGAVSPRQVTLTWRDNSRNETAFALWRKGGGPRTQVVPSQPTEGEWVRLVVLPPDRTSYTDREAQPGTRYTYRVRAIGKAGASAWSNEASVTTPER
jgi:hypothetical protein